MAVPKQPYKSPTTADSGLETTSQGDLSTNNEKAVQVDSAEIEASNTKMDSTKAAEDLLDRALFLIDD